MIVNTTPHPINFEAEGAVVQVPCDKAALLNAKAKSIEVGADLVTTKFSPTAEGQDLIEAIETACAETYGAEMPVRIVGSMIAAQAYPMQVVAMTPAPGFERVAPAEKRMNPDRFTVFLK